MLDKIRNRIETIINGGGQDAPFSLASFLTQLSFVYEWIMKLRLFCYQKGIFKAEKLPCRVISIGNITTGGTGKTPMAVNLIKHLQHRGLKVVLVSRGYKGGAEKTGGIVSDGSRLLMGSEEAGDEPCMLASILKNVPVLVGANRFRNGMLAVRTFNPDVIVLDDAFQHLKLQRDINIVLLDAARPFGNRHLLPRGILREPLSGLHRADALILTRSDEDTALSSQAVKDGLQAALPSDVSGGLLNCPIFRASHMPYVAAIIRSHLPAEDSTAFHRPLTDNSDSGGFEFLSGKRGFAFSGIARNDAFQRTIAEFHCREIGFRSFPDHHFYSDDDVQTILAAAHGMNADYLLTTEKDYVRLKDRFLWPLDLVVIGVTISLGDDEQRFNAFIQDRLSSPGK